MPLESVAPLMIFRMEQKGQKFQLTVIEKCLLLIYLWCTFYRKEVDSVSSYLAAKEKVREVGICTINPADGHRLENGQEQQTGTAARVVIIDLKHVDSPLDRW